MAKIIFVLEDVDGQVSVKMDVLEHDGEQPTQAAIVGLSLYNACVALEGDFKDKNVKEAD